MKTEPQSIQKAWGVGDKRTNALSLIANPGNTKPLAALVTKNVTFHNALQVEVLQVIYKEYTFDEFVDFSNSTFEMNWKVNNLLTEIQNVSDRVKVSWKAKLAQSL